MKSISEYQRGGRPVEPVNLLLLLSELEGSSQHLKYMGFDEDEEILNVMKRKYYKMYFSLNKNK